MQRIPIFVHWFRPPPLSMGVEISAHSIKAVAFGFHRGTLDVAFHYRRPLADGVVVEGEIRNAAVLADALRGLRDAAADHLGEVPPIMASLPEQRSFVQVLRLPAVADPAKLAEAVRWETAGTIPDPIESVALDFYELPDAGVSHRDVVVGTSAKTVVDAMAEALERAGFVLEALEIESAATLRSLFKQSRTSVPTLIVDIGEGRTSFIIAAGEAILFTSTLPMGVALFEEAVAKELGVSRQDARKALRSATVMARGTSGNPRVGQALIPALTDMSQQVREYLAYYRTHAEHAHTAARSIQEVVLCGGGANIDGLPEYFSLQLKLPVRQGDPWAAARERGLRNIPRLPFGEALSFSAAIGLALHRYW